MKVELIPVDGQRVAVVVIEAPCRLDEAEPLAANRPEIVAGGARDGMIELGLGHGGVFPSGWENEDSRRDDPDGCCE